MEAYYYNHMSKIQQSAYHAIKVGLLAQEASFAVPIVEGRELQDIFMKLRLDCPEIFYAVGFRYRFSRDASHVEMIPEYMFDRKKVKEHQKAMTARIEKLVRPAKGISELEKELYIHDFICAKVHYDKLKKPYSHEIIGPLGQGVGVCEGIAKAVKVLSDELGIWCMIAISEANPDKQIKYRHAWNVIRIGGNYYHMDATFDRTLSSAGHIRYDYFNLDDGHIFRDHEPILYEAPQCSDTDHFYYREKKLSFTKPQEIVNRAQQAIRKGKPLVFHWRGGYLTREVLTEICAVLEQTALKKDKHAQIRLNWPQAVLFVLFTDKLPEEELFIEDVEKIL